jgi:hypothetical protein
MRYVVNHADLEWTTEGSPNGGERVTLRAGDYVTLPAGAAHAHRVLNESDADFIYLCLSTMEAPDVVLYPDSGKIGVFVGAAPGGRPERSTLKRYLDASAEIPYWRDEED